MSNFRSPDRYRHIDQFIEKIGVYDDNIDGIISRREACRWILDIMKKLGIPWDREPKPLSGWR